jgi:hypothetical protein
VLGICSSQHYNVMYIAKGRFILHGWKDKVSPLIVPRFYPGKSMERQASKEQKFLIVFSLKPDSTEQGYCPRRWHPHQKPLFLGVT